MSDSQGSSSEPPMKRYLKDDYVPEDAIPSWESLYEKTAAVEKIRRLYMKNFWTFTYYHNALFHMFSMEDLAFCLTNPIEAKYYGDGAKYFASRLVHGRRPGQLEPPIARNYPAPSVEEAKVPAAAIAFEVPKRAASTPDLHEIGGSRKRAFSVSADTKSVAKKTLSSIAQLSSRVTRSTSTRIASNPVVSSDTDMEPAGPTALPGKGQARSTRSKFSRRKPVDSLTFVPPAQDDTESEKETHHKPKHPTATAALVDKRRRSVRKDVDKRDNEVCIVTNRGIEVERVHIVPHTINAQEADLAHLPIVFDIAERLLGNPFRTAIETYLNGVMQSDFPWNVLTLTNYLHGLWDNQGLVAFRPRYIDEADGGFYATFTFHWLTKSAAETNARITSPLDAQDCHLMVDEHEEFAAKKHYMWETVYTPTRRGDDKRPLEDGRVCRVWFRNKRNALMMMHMLDLRWAAGRLLFLAGGAGEDLVTPRLSSSSSSSGFDQGIRLDFGSESGLN